MDQDNDARPRDAERSQAQLLDAALAEFAAIIVSQRLRLESQQSAHTELLTQLLS